MRILLLTFMYYIFHKARAKYLSVAKQMKAFEDHLYEEWKTQVEIVLPGLLKRNLLVKPSDKQAPIVPADDDTHDYTKEAGMNLEFF